MRNRGPFWPVLGPRFTEVGANFHRRRCEQIRVSQESVPRSWPAMPSRSLPRNSRSVTGRIASLSWPEPPNSSRRSSATCGHYSGSTLKCSKSSQSPPATRLWRRPAMTRTQRGVDGYKVVRNSLMSSRLIAACFPFNSCRIAVYSHSSSTTLRPRLSVEATRLSG